MHYRLALILNLFILVFCYGLIFSLIGGGVLSRERQRNLGFLSPALGLLLGYLPIVVLSGVFSRTTAFIILVFLVFVLWVFALRREKIVGIGWRLVWAIKQAAILAFLSALFWGPGVVGQHYGLFTERGGDLTIYAGTPAKAGDHPLWSWADITSVSQGFLERSPYPWGFAAQHISPADDPPAPGWSMQRLVDLKWTVEYTGWFGLQQVLYTIPIDTLEIRYWALTALLWVLMVSGLAQTIFLWAGSRYAILAFSVFAASHGLVQVGYNHYYPALLGSLLISTIVCLIVLPPRFRLNPIVLVLLCFSLPFIVLVAYYPLIPLIFVPCFTLALYQGKSLPSSLRKAWGMLAARSKAVTIMGAGAWIAAAGVLILFQLRSMLNLLDGLKNSPKLMLYLGQPRTYDGTWLAALFGAFNIHQLLNYAKVPPLPGVSYLVAAAGVALCLAIALSILSGWRAWRAALNRRSEWQPGSDWRLFNSMAISIALGSIGIIILGSKSEYTQFKALTYGLPYLLLLLMFPVPAAQNNRLLNNSIWTLRVMLLLGLLFFRVQYALNIVFERTAAILDTSLPRLVGEVRALDPKAFLLAEPPSNSHFPLWELGLRDQRSLLTQYYNYTQPREQYLSAPDIQHIWILKRGEPATVPPDAFSMYDLWLYRPLSSANCSVKEMPSDGGLLARRDFRFFGSTSERLWLDRDMRYYVFNPAQAAKLALALKPFGNNPLPQTVDVLYPYPMHLPLNIEKSAKNSILATIPHDAILNGNTGSANPLVVLQLKGLFYSLLVCSN